MLKPLAALLCMNAYAAHFDPPDLSLEYQLHKQYQMSQGEIPQSNQGLIESYKLQNGETLWSLSQMLYGDGNYWPKVWAQNKSITNPHLVRPGHMLQFQMGSEDETPSFRFSEADEPGLELAAAPATPAQIEIPPPESPPKPVIGVPKSFPQYQDAFRARKDVMGLDDSHIMIERQRHAEIIPLTAWVQEDAIVPSGEYMEVEKESGLAAPNQVLYVKVKKGTAQVGQKFLIVKDFGVIRKINRQVEGKINARFIEVYGDVELVEQVESHFKKDSDAQNFDAFRARMLHASSLSRSGFALIPGEMQMVNMSNSGSEGSTVAQVLGSQKHSASAIYGPGDLVFLNKGASDGLTEGQLLHLYMDRSIRDYGTPITYSSVSSGVVKVVKVSATVATAVVLSSVDSIQQGDRVQPLAMRSGGAAPEAQPFDEAPPADEKPAGSDFDLSE